MGFSARDSWSEPMGNAEGGTRIIAPSAGGPPSVHEASGDGWGPSDEAAASGEAIGAGEGAASTAPVTPDAEPTGDDAVATDAASLARFERT